MTMQQRKSRRHNEAAEEELEEQTPVAEDTSLDHDVACCLADIDKVLGEGTERDKALAEWHDLDTWDEDAVETFNVRWSFLNLQAEKECCGCGCETVLWENGERLATV